MEIDPLVKSISIMRGPYNAYHAEAFGLILKLSYAFTEIDKPRLEIFLDDNDARSEEWSIYGTLLDDGDGRLARVQFNAVGERKIFTIESLRYQIVFESFRHEMFTYPNGSMEHTPVYDFLTGSLS